MDDPQRYLDPLTLAKIRSLELQARLIVEGYLSGMHKSPYHGFSVEFAQHREYVPGDDIKHVDWKVYGRTDRFFLKQYEEEVRQVVGARVQSGVAGVAGGVVALVALRLDDHPADRPRAILGGDYEGDSGGVLEVVERELPGAIPAPGSPFGDL